MRTEAASIVRCVTGLSLGLALASASAGVGQDRAAVVSEMKVLLDNDCVRMQFHDVGVGETTPMHSHPRYAVYVFDAYELSLIHIC